MKTKKIATTTTTAAEITPALKYGRTVIKGDLRIAIKIRLDDQCKNGHEDFSITADIDVKDIHGRWREYSCGCCHDEILSAVPAFRQFVDLHLSDWSGAPMYAAGNGFYHWKENRETCKRYIRATDQQMVAIADWNPHTEAEFYFIMEEIGFRKQWKAEADSAIAELERLTGKKFESRATRQHWEPLDAETVELIRTRRAEGYYTPEAIAARDAEAAAAAVEKKRAEILADYSKAEKKAADEKQIALYFLERGMDKSNVIFYNHTHTLAFNWNTSRYCKEWTDEEYAAFVESADLSALPEGIQFSLKD